MDSDLAFSADPVGTVERSRGHIETERGEAFGGLCGEIDLQGEIAGVGGGGIGMDFAHVEFGDEVCGVDVEIFFGPVPTCGEGIRDGFVFADGDFVPFFKTAVGNDVEGFARGGGGGFRDARVGFGVANGVVLEAV